MIQKISLIFITIFLLSCGPSDQEKQNIATITCNIMGESRNMDAAMRIKEINFAREKLAEEPFLEGDAKIKESFEYGLCKQLVINDPEYDSELSLIKEQIRAREEQEAKEERDRLKILAEERLNKERERKEKERKEEKRKEELKRIADAKASKEKKEKIKQFTDNVIETFKSHPPKPTLKKIHFPNWTNFGVRLGCKNFRGVGFRVVVIFKEHGQVVGPERTCDDYLKDNDYYFGLWGLKRINERDYKSEGYYIPPENSSSISDPKELNNFLKTTKNPKNSIESIYILLDGYIFVARYMTNFIYRNDYVNALEKKMNPATYGLKYPGGRFKVPKEYEKFILYESKN